MNCKICGSNGWINRGIRTEPDKYEKWMGIENVRRRWRKCLGCGVWEHWRNYDLAELEKIYSDGYRDPKFRGDNIRQAMLKIYNLPDEKSENHKRIEWLLKTMGLPDTLLDIGSGLGVFPLKLRELGTSIKCVEYNNESIEMLKWLRVECLKEIPDEKFDLISMTHVLEHIETPVEYLESLHNNLEEDGRLFIEVPDAIEFELLPPVHDDFNSCHTHFYDVPGLMKLLNRAEFEATDIHRVHYEERNTHRIMTVCKKRP